MAERHVIRGNLAPNNHWELSGSTTSTGAWIGDASNKWALTKAGTITTNSAEFVEFDGRRCVRLSATGGAASAILSLTNTTEYPGASQTSAVLDQYIKIESGRSYTVSVDVWLVAGGTNIKAENSFRSYSHVQNRIRSTSASTQTTGQWVTLSQTFTANKLEKYYTCFFVLSQVAASAWSGEAYFSNPSVVDNTAPARTAATSRLAVRDMGQAYLFDGVDDYLEVADADLPASYFQEGFTAWAWINPRGWGGSNEGRIFDKSVGTAAPSGVVVRVSTAGGVLVRIGAGGSFNATTVGLKLNKWDFVSTSVAPDGTISVYKNGVFVSSGTSGDLADITTTNVLRIGNRSTATDRTFAGRIAQPGLINRALTDAEILALYQDAAQSAGATVFTFGKDTPVALTVSGATLSPDVPIKPRVAVRDMGTALSFDGVDDVVKMNTVTSATFTQTGSYAVSGWFKVNQYPSGGQEKCIWNFQNGGSDRHSLMFNTDGVVGFQRYNGASYFGKLSSPLITNRFYHYVCVNDAGTMRLYINGIEQTTVGNKYAAGDSNNAFWVGFMNSVNGAACINGIIDEPRIWSRALSAQEVSDLYYNNIVPRNGLVAEYLFDEASGSTALDTSGNGNDGTITGATYTTDVPIVPRTAV